jgi:transcriptional regulator with XRE-family HTH domain
MSLDQVSKQIRSAIRYKNIPFLKAFGERLKKLRESKGYSMDRLSNESSGVNRSSLSRIERGLTDPQIGTIKRIADTIGIAIMEFFKK